MEKKFKGVKLPTLTNGCDAVFVKRRKYYRRKNMGRRKAVLPRKEPECIKHVANFLNRDKNKYKTKFRIKKDIDEFFVPEAGTWRCSDAVIYAMSKIKEGNNKIVTKLRRIISLEFEEHLQDYSILKDIKRCPTIHVPLRKLDYYRFGQAQYWIKIDSDGTPICIPYAYIVKNQECLHDIGAQGKFVNRNQRNMILAAERDEEGNFPSYVLIGWRSIFKEFRRILKAYDDKKKVDLLVSK